MQQMPGSKFNEIMGAFDTHFGRGKAIPPTARLDEYSSDECVDMVCLLEKNLSLTRRQMDALFHDHVKPRDVVIYETIDGEVKESVVQQSSTIVAFVDAAISVSGSAVAA